MVAQPPLQIRMIYKQLADSALAYQVIAEKADGTWRSLFAEISASRGPMIRALANAVERVGEKMPLPGSVGGIVDRIWLRVRDAISHPDMQMVVEESERAEARLLDHYDQALADGDLPGHMKRILAQQRGMIAGNLSAMQSSQDTNAET